VEFTDPTQACRKDTIAEMQRYVGDGSDIDNVILVGGGAFFFKPIIKEAFPKHKILELGDGLYANVRGFQIAGMELAKSMVSATELQRVPSEAEA
jgi:plasmid segregation protein ParM